MHRAIDRTEAAVPDRLYELVFARVAAGGEHPSERSLRGVDHLREQGREPAVVHVNASELPSIRTNEAAAHRRGRSCRLPVFCTRRALS